MASVDTYPSEVRAQAKYLRTAPRKAQLVADQIRGRTVPEARTILAFTTRDAARDMEKVLNSAVANAEANHGLVGDDLIVSAAFVGEGPTLKRWRARARGRAARIRKRTCHITVALARTDGELMPAPRGQAPVQAETTPVTPRRGKQEAPETDEATETTETTEAKPKAAAKPKAKPKAETAEKPKPKRAAKPKAETAAEDKPKPKTTRKKKET